MLTAGAVGFGLLHPERLDSSVTVYESICRQLIDNVTEGRQALVGSVWWPPVPVLLRLPVVYLVPGLPGLPSLLVSVGAGVLTLLLLARFCRRRRLGWPGWLLTAAVALNPAWLQRLTDGSSGTLAVLLMVLTALAAYRWLETGTLRGLTAFGGSAALLALTGFDAGLWLMAAVVLTALLRRTVCAGGAEHRAALLLALLPLLYGYGLWMLMNWLIMGDGVYFLRPLLQGSVASRAPGGASVISPVEITAAVVIGLAALRFVWRRHMPGLCLAAVSLVPLALALGLARVGLLWDGSPLLSAVVPLAALTMGAACALPPPGRRRWDVPACLAALALLVVPHVFTAGARDDSAPPAGIPDAARVRADIAQVVNLRSPHALVFVCGYPSYRLLGADGGETFRHALDFNFHQARLDYWGHDLYLLVRMPGGRDAVDSIHWQIDRMYELGSRNTLYVGDWNGWRLFELIQAPVQRPVVKEHP